MNAAFDKIKECTHEISLNRRILANSYNIEEIEKIEADIRHKASVCKSLSSENARIRKWLNQNEKAKDSIHEHGFYRDEMSKLKQTYRDDKQAIRELYYDTLRKRKQLIEKHDIVVRKENNIRKMKELIDTTK